MVKVMLRAAKIPAILLVAVGFLAVASYLTTGIYWDGHLPVGEFRLHIRTPEGQPVKGAILRVYCSGTRDLAFGYPLDNHLAGQDLVSDESGQITALQRNYRLKFGGFKWDLFWVIPIGARKAPDVDCEVSADGFRPLQFSIWRLFKSSYRSYEAFPKTTLPVDGNEIELPVYDQTFMLERQLPPAGTDR
jgi:hypothetical protein